METQIVKSIFERVQRSRSSCSVARCLDKEGNFSFAMTVIESNGRSGSIILSQEEALRLADAIQVECLRKEEETSLARQEEE